LPGARVVCGRICERVARATLTDGDQVIRPTLSAGIAASAQPTREFSFAELVKAAQGGLDAAQGLGGNQVEARGPQRLGTLSEPPRREPA
jgi:GGDEF domain-containing protein